ncbi:helix-turn-helix transcriptional regulator [Cohnella nanjingensis]|uniref:AraC family transcriptional regulator n=1 Tax=Cohnella nanjingensis TaxID=1387779 RepID=A0A7X0VI11_9BACL|nr:AraC family transcriptional regulator [Cohnella nanjingensis]MBB6674722.1 AraC family transcriptional regulator [Cohnella nanjingensis]
MIIRMPQLLSGAYFRMGPGERFYFPLHQHESNAELLLIVDGEGEFRVDNRLYRARTGSLLVYNRGIWHEERSTSDTFSAIYAGYAGLQLRGLPSDFLVGGERAAVIELNEHFVPVKQLLGEMIAEWNQALPESAEMANALLALLMGRLARLLYSTEERGVRRRPAKETVHLAKRYMEENYYADIRLNALSRLTHTNAYHLIHMFKQETGTSPIQYLIRYRMEVAKQYLETTRLPMPEIAEKVGYKSETYFQNLFKKTVGISPGKYRDSVRPGRGEA